MENKLRKGVAYDRVNRIRLVVKKWFDCFMIEEYINRNLDMIENDFVKFWIELFGDNE